MLKEDTDYCINGHISVPFKEALRIITLIAKYITKTHDDIKQYFNAHLLIFINN